MTPYAEILSQYFINMQSLDCLPPDIIKKASFSMAWDKQKNRNDYSTASVSSGEGTGNLKKLNLSMLILALALGTFSIGIGEFAVMSLLPNFAKGLHISIPDAGNVISAYALGVVIGAPIIAIGGAWQSRRHLLIGMMLLFMLGNTASALAPNYHWMLLFRFISGLPHGAFFGISMLVAAAQVPFEQRSRVIGRVFFGLTLSTLFGVPIVTAFGQYLGWRWGFGSVAILATITFILIIIYCPYDAPNKDESPLSEVKSMGRIQIWLTLLIAAIGFGGMFTIYSYIGATLTEVTHISPHLEPMVLFIFGSGMVLGNIIASWFADKSLLPTIGGLLIWSILSELLFFFVAGNIWLLTIDVFLIGGGVALSPLLQTRLMDVAGKAQTLAASLNHSAFNIANAIGPFLGGEAIRAGFGYQSTGWVGALLAAGGLAFFLISIMIDSRHNKIKA